MRSFGCRDDASEMKYSKVVGGLVGLAWLSAALLVAGVVLAYLTEYGSRRFLIAAAVAAGGLLAAGAVYYLPARRLQGSRAAAMAAALLLLLLVPLLSTIWPGRVTQARFGLTVYGLIPVPALDITVGHHGLFWFRDKSHHVALGEVQSLLSDDTEVVIIGIGWHSAVMVDPAVRSLAGYQVHILPTPEAFELYNRCVSLGKRVVLLAHTTC